MKKLLVIVCLFTSLSVFSQTDSLEYKIGERKALGWTLTFMGMGISTFSAFTDQTHENRGIGGILTITGLALIFDSNTKSQNLKKSKNKNK